MPPEEQKALLWTSAEDFPLHLGSGFSFLAEEDGATVGFLMVFREPLLREPQLYIDGIATAASHRRNGVAEMLLKALVDKAKAEGIRQVRTLISLDNPRSQGLDRKLGFVLTERIEARLDL